MSIIMTGGGTGGHLTIIKAVKEALVVRSEALGSRSDMLYVGSTKGQDKQWFEQDDDFVKKYFFETRGVVNQGFIGKMKSLFMLAKATIQAISILRKHKATVVFCVGGFSAAPMAFAAKLTRTPLVIHEQNAAIGSLNRVLKPYAHTFISSYLQSSPIHAYPIKHIFFEYARGRERVQTVLFLGGSQGAKAINDLAIDLAPLLQKKGIKIIHQAGEKHIDKVTHLYHDLGIDAEVFGFTTTLAEKMQRADFAIARAGASTLWELSATALPTLYIPYPYAAKDHQYHNAQFLVEKNLAWVRRESEIETEEILSLLEQNMQEKSQGLMQLIEPHGSQQIATLLETFQKGKQRDVSS